MKLIPQWRKAWRFASVRVALAAVAFGGLDQATQAAMLAMLHVPAERLPAVLGLIILATRVTTQGMP